MNSSLSSRPYIAAYTLLRVVMGLNFVMHGVVRLPKLDGFRSWMVKLFADSVLPSGLVSAWASVLPFVELGIGVLLLAGLSTFRASVAGAVVMGALVTGTCLLEKWDLVASQMMYAAWFVALVAFVDHDKWSVDGLRATRS